MKQYTYTLIILFSFLFTSGFGQPATNVVISQIYGGGGNAGAPYLNDYVELFNPTLSPVILTGWSLQYASATGSSWGITPLSGSIAAGGYFLIQQSSGGTSGIPLPTPDATDNTSMAAGSGKIALCNDVTALTGTCPTGPAIVDFAGYGATASCFEGAGAAPAPSNTMSIFRTDSSCTDANDNALDFAAAAPDPRNSVSLTHTCAPTAVLENATPRADNPVIYPNPVKETCTVYNLQCATCRAEVYDILGNLVLSPKPLESGRKELALDVSGLLSGIYFIRFTDEKNIRTAKFVKQ